MSRSVLFDWSLLLLSGEAGRQPEEGSQFWALVALREGLAALPDDTIKPWAAALFDTCERLLDSEDTSPRLLKPLLDVLTQVHTFLQFPSFTAEDCLVQPRFCSALWHEDFAR